MQDKIPSIFLKTVEMCGAEHVTQKNDGYFVVEDDKIIASSAPKGLKMEAISEKGVIRAKVLVERGVKIKNPLFFCFGIAGEKTRQLVVPEITLEENSEIKLYSHCSFPNSDGAFHDMEGRFYLKQGAKLEYYESHYHGSKSGAQVFPRLKVFLDEKSSFFSEFSLSKGNVGHVKIELDLELKKDARAEIETKVLGKNSADQVEIIDRVWLKEDGAKSLIKMRAAAKNGGSVVMQGETYAEASNTIGHIDCQEIVIGKGSIAKAIPIVQVSNDQARVTHEASVGKINQKELETLLTRGLSEDQAVEMIVEAMMR